MILDRPLRWPKTTLLLFVVLTLAAAYAARTVRIDNTPDTWLPSVDAALSEYREFRDRFGDDSILLVTTDDPRPDDPRWRAEARALADALEALPSVRAVEPPLLEPAAPTDRSGAPPQLLQSPLAPHLIGAPGTLAGFAILPRDDLTASDRSGMVVTVQSIVDTHQGTLGRLRLSGTDVITYDLDEGSKRSLGGLAPFVVLIMGGVLWGATRSGWAVVATILAVIGSSVWTIGLLALAGRSLNLVVVVMPAILAVLTTAQAMHLLSRFRSLELPEGSAPDRAAREQLWREAIRQTWRPCLLSAATTTAGFASLGLSEIPPVRDLGLFTAVGVVFSFVLTFTVLPAVLVGRARTLPTPQRQRRWTRERAIIATAWLRRHSVAILLVGAAGLALSAVGLERLRLESHILQFFPSEHRIPQNYGDVEKHLFGLTPFELWIEGPRAEVLAPETLEAIDQVLVQARDAEPLVTTAMRPLDLAGLANLARQAPPDRRAHLLPGSIQDLPDALRRFVFLDDDHVALRFTLAARTGSSNECDALARRLRGRVEATFPPGGPVSARITGAAALLIHGQILLLRTQISSFAMALAAVLAVIWLALRSAKLLLAALVANLLPVAVTLGGMGLLDIPLNTATVTVAGIALGIIIDDTIHVLHAYGEARRNGREPDTAIADTLLHVGRPVFLTTVAVALGFGAFAFSPFRPTLYFGTLIAGSSVAALVCDLFLLPVLLQRIERTAGDPPA